MLDNLDANNIQQSDKKNLLLNKSLNIFFARIDLKTLVIKIDNRFAIDIFDNGVDQFKSELNLLDFCQRYMRGNDIIVFNDTCKKVSEAKSEKFNQRIILNLINFSNESVPYLFNIYSSNAETITLIAQSIDDLSITSNVKKEQPSLRMLFETSGDCVFLVDCDAILIDFNDVFKDKVSRFLKKEIYVGMKCAEIIPEVLKEEFNEVFFNALNKRSSNKEFTLTFDDDYNFESSIHPLIENDIVVAVSIIMKDVTDANQYKKIDDLEKLVLEQAVRYEEAQDVVYSLLTGIETIAPDFISFTTIKRANEMVLDWFTYLSLPEKYIENIPFIKINADYGSCGNSAYTREPCLVNSISNDHKWTNFKDISLLYGLKSCFSFPILNKSGEVLGTIGSYLKEERDLTQFEYVLLQRASRIVGIIYDKKLVEEEIEKHIADIKEIGSLIPGVLYKTVTDELGSRKFVFVSDRVKDFLGVEPQVIYDNYDIVWSFVHPEDVNIVRDSLKSALETNTTWICEFRFLNSLKDEYFWARVTANTVKGADDKYFTYGAISDVTDLKINEFQLNAVISAIDDVVFLFSEDEFCRNVWIRDEKATFYNGKLCVGKKYIEIFGELKHELFVNALQKIGNSYDPIEYECSVKENDTIVFYKARIGRLKCALDENLYFYTFRDVTALKESQKQSERLSEILKVAGNLGKMGAWEYNILTKEVLWSEELYKIFDINNTVKGLDLYQTYIDALHPDEKVIQSLKLQEAISSKLPYNNTHRIVLHNGEEKWIVSISNLVRDENGIPYLLRGVTQDITEIRNAQKLLEIEQNLLRQANDVGKIGAFHFDFVTEIVNWNHQVFVTFDLDDNVLYEDVYNMYLDSIYADDKEELFALIERLKTKGIPFTHEHRILTKIGNLKHVYCNADPEIVNGEVVGINGIVQDITQRKLAELEVKKNSRLLEVIALASLKLLGETNHQETINVLLEEIGLTVNVNRVYIFKVESNNTSTYPSLSPIFEWNDGTVTTFLKNEIFENATFSSLNIIDFYNNLNAGLVINGNVSTFDVSAKDYFSQFDVKSTLIVPVFFEGNLWGYFGFDECKKERNWMESEVSLLTSVSGIIGNALRNYSQQLDLYNSELKYRTVVSAMREGVVLQDRNGEIITCNKNAESILGLSYDQMVGVSSLDPVWKTINEEGNLLPGELHPAMVALATGKPVLNFVMGIHRSDDKLIWILINSLPVFANESTVPTAIVTTFGDITEQKNNELELTKLSVVAKLTSNLVIVADANAVVEWVNNSFTKITDYGINEVVGRNLVDVFFGTDANSDSIVFMKNKILNQEPFDLEILNYRNNRDEYWLKIEVKPIFNNKNKLVNLVVIGTEITETKRIENLIKLSFEEKEMLISDFKNNIGNSFSVVESLLRLQQLSSKDDYTKQLFSESWHRVKNLELISQEINLFSDKTSANVNTYLIELVDHYKKVYQNSAIDIELSVSSDDLTLNSSKVFSFAIIVNELLSNAIRHTLSGRLTGVVKVNLEENGNYYLLEIVDNGVGLPNGFEITESHTLGINLIKTLTNQLKGTIEFRNNKGTHCTLTFPKN